MLKDLPPKILQDVYCDLSPLQSVLHEEFSASPASVDIQKSIAGGERGMDTADTAPHVFQVISALPYTTVKIC